MEPDDTALVPRARVLAERLHAGQVDKHGRPYIEHLAAVVAILLRRWPDAPEEAVAAAWMHDVIEDARATVYSLIAAGMSPEAVDLILCLTRGELRYHRWIEGLAASRNEWAIRIKLADLEHNCDQGRRIAGSDIVERRYEPAWRVLEAALEGRDG